MEDLKLQVLAGNILLLPDQAADKTAGGLVLPDHVKKKPGTGKVVLTGGDKPDEPMEISLGDTVTYGKYGGTELVIEGQEYLLMNQKDVLCFSKV